VLLLAGGCVCHFSFAYLMWVVWGQRKGCPGYFGFYRILSVPDESVIW
jgi:hypothetical protein